MRRKLMDNFIIITGVITLYYLCSVRSVWGKALRVPDAFDGNNILHTFGQRELSSGKSKWEDSDPEQGIHLQGDILDDLPQTKQGFINRDKRWPNATLVYHISGVFNETERNLLKRAMEEISSKTCIKFRIRKADEVAFVNITKPESGCSSHVGRQGGEQNVNLGPKCFRITQVNVHGYGKAAHEFIHALGFKHEHARPDRDEYILIEWDKIDKVHEPNFDKANPRDFSTFGVPYDYNSIMHYPRDSFRKEGAEGPTITPIKSDPSGKDPNIGQRAGLSETDVEKLNRMYDCQL